MTVIKQLMTQLCEKDNVFTFQTMILKFIQYYCSNDKLCFCCYFFNEYNIKNPTIFYWRTIGEL